MQTVMGHAQKRPDQKAFVIGETGQHRTYSELATAINRLSNLFLSNGLKRGDHVAVLLENNIHYAEIVMAAMYSGLYLTTVNRYLTGEEAAFIVNDSEAKILISSFALAETARDAVAAGIENCPTRLMVDGTIDGWASYEIDLAAQSETPIAERWFGGLMLYSSGTTGRPKGILRDLEPRKFDDLPNDKSERPLPSLASFDIETVYLSPSPLYHSAPISYLRHVLTDGGTYLTMQKFNAETTLELIERYRVTHSQFVPTMFVRMLRLPDDVRGKYDISSLGSAIHAAAPCPPEVKRKMIDWWGPIIYEYYGATETGAQSMVSSEEWLKKPGTVGRAPSVHICDEDGNELEPRQIGQIWAEVPPFRYKNDPEKTKEAWHCHHPNWATCGDVGYLDEDGYLFLTDRLSFMIISGGVNIYPQAIENALALHPLVEDSAVIGVPDEDLGEAVKAVIQLRENVTITPKLVDEIRDFLRTKVGRHMIPKTVDFTDELPRLPTGKLYKEKLRKRYL